MSQATLESLEARVAMLERRLAGLIPPPTEKPTRFKDWRQAIGMFPDNELMRQIDEAGREYRDADRRATSE